MKKLSIYLARPISGCTPEEVMEYYSSWKKKLTDLGYYVFQPMTGKGQFRPEVEFKSHGYKTPISSNHAIIERDRWMVSQADVIFANLLNTKNVSIGTCMELAWAHDKGKHSIVALEQGNVHEHAFILEAADIVFDNTGEVEDYLDMLINQESKLETVSGAA